MNPRTLIGLCVLAAFGGAVASGVLMSSSPGTASASSSTDPAEPKYGSDHWKPHADIACIIHISHASIQGSNICTKDSTATWTDKSSGGGDGGESGSGEGGSTTVIHKSETHETHTTETKDCDASGLVTVQACHVVNDSFNENEVLNENDVLSDNTVVVTDSVKVVEDTVVTVTSIV